MSEAEQFEFKAETQRVLSLVINSLYTHSEVFLRELISNASDALDKARFLQLSEKDAVVEVEGEPGIDITLDEEANTLVIEDNGVGMTRDEVVENLGTIAKSGTDQFAEAIGKLKDTDDKEKALELIGQFGVGFYSAFMVASRVDVETLSIRKDEKPVVWRSGGEGTYTLLEGERETPGTKITVHLKKDSDEFAKKWRVNAIIKKYSDFVMFPIRVDGDVVNKSSALWRSPRSQVTEEQYAEFFKHVTQGRHGDKPLATIHYSVDAPVQFSALLFVPERSGMELFMLEQKKLPGLRLYAKRVLIQENCESLLPNYLRFVRGVVDSEDLTLNVSRETLQENRTVKQMEVQLTKQVLKELTRLSEDDEDAYEKLWKEFGQVIKEGVSQDFKNRELLCGLCRFETLLGEPGKLTSFREYIANMKAEQKEIFYIAGPGREHVLASPHLEVFRDKGIDVLLFVDPIDEWVAQGLASVEDHQLRSVTHGELDLGSDDEADENEKETEGEEKSQLDATIAAIKAALAPKVDEVRTTNRLTETASCLVSNKGDPGANLERIMKMIDGTAEERKRVLEVNPKHPFVKNLNKLVAMDAESDRVKVFCQLLYDQALLSEGVVEDPAKLVKRIQDLLVESSSHAVGS